MAESRAQLVNELMGEKEDLETKIADLIANGGDNTTVMTKLR